MEQMTQEQIDFQERKNTGTSWTRNEKFESDGYFVVPNLWDPKELYRPVPSERGQVNYWGTKLDQFSFQPIENQVEGSIASYWHPQYRSIHSSIRIKIEKIIGRKLYNTYYYDRYYFPGQELRPHADRDACEISVTVNISTSLTEDWPIWIKTPDVYEDKTKSKVIKYGESRSVILKPGDGMIYKGCERPHWRYPMPGIKKTTIGGYEDYYHQVFFHYVLADGVRSHFAFDSIK